MTDCVLKLLVCAKTRALIPGKYISFRKLIEVDNDALIYNYCFKYDSFIQSNIFKIILNENVCILNRKAIFKYNH